MILSLVDILVKIIDRMILPVGEYLGKDNGQDSITCWWISWPR